MLLFSALQPGETGLSKETSHRREKRLARRLAAEHSASDWPGGGSGSTEAPDKCCEEKENSPLCKTKLRFLNILITEGPLSSPESLPWVLSKARGVPAALSTSHRRILR